MLTPQQIEAARKKYGVTPSTTKSTLTPAQVDAARQKYGVIPVSNGFPTTAPDEVKMSLSERMSALGSGAKKALDVGSKLLFENTGKIGGTLLMRSGVLGKEAQEKGGQIDITKGDVGLAALETVPFTKVGKAITKVALSPLTKVATKLYESALKPAVSAVGKSAKEVLAARKELARIGLDEKVWLTQGGVERVATKIDEMERALGEAIDAGKAAGAKIPTDKMAAYMNDIKTTFSNIADVDAGKASVKELDQLTKSFIKEYGKEIPIEKAQAIKTATYSILKKSYGKLSTVNTEGQKQIARFLKDEIVDAAPVIGDVNKRLSSLYKFDQALSKASGRLGNLNLLGIGTKIGGAIGGVKGGVVGALLDLIDKPTIKSGMAISLDQLTKGAVGARIPAAVILKNLAEIIRDLEQPPPEGQ